MKLYPFQKVGALYLEMRERALLADQQGLGKTVQGLHALEHGGRALVICPRIVRPVWVDHCQRLRPDYHVTEIKVRAKFRWPEPYELVVVNYDILPDRVAAPPPHVTVIPDEAHYAKAGPYSQGGSSQRGEKTRDLVGLCLKNGGRVWAMTGTPQPNEPPDLWYVMKLVRLEKSAWGDWQDFRRMYNAVDRRITVRRGKRSVEIDRTFWGRTPHPDVRRGFQRVALRRTRKQVLPELPGKQWRTLRVPCMNREATILADNVMIALRRANLDPDMALLRLVGGPEPPGMSAARRLISGLKVRACCDLLDVMEPQGQVVVFSAHRAPVEALSTRPRWGALMGGMSEEVREQVIADFQAGKLNGIAATIGSAREGITLTAAHEVIFVDRAWVPKYNEQAEDRVCRIGQNMGVTITDIVADHEFDEILIRVLKVKQERITAGIGE